MFFALATSIKNLADTKAGSMEDNARETIITTIKNEAQAALHRLAAEGKTYRLDDVTTLLRVEGDKTTLRYIYEVSATLSVLPPSLIRGVQQ